MNNVMLDIRVLGKSPDSPILPSSVPSLNRQPGRSAPDTTALLISQQSAVFIQKRSCSL